MIRLGRGNLLEADVDALVNTVNTRGVMGKGIALQFRRAFPTMYEDYLRAAKAGEVQLGKMHIWQTKSLTGPRFIINFPTKGHWKANSKLTDIERGLDDLVRVVQELSITSLAVPPLGCGQGGLDWRDVEPRIREALGELHDVDVVVYPPAGAPASTDMRTGTEKPLLTPGRAALLVILQRYTERAVTASQIEVQKLLYFLQAAGEPLKLHYGKGLYGPYADNLRHVLTRLEGHYLMGYGDGSAPVQEAEPIRLLPGAEDQAASELADHPRTTDRIDRVLTLTEGFESAYGMELLASIHWVAARESPTAANDPAVAARLVRSWNARKGRMFTADHVEATWRHLHQGGWLTPT